MGTVPIVIFRGLRQSHAQGHGELGPPHFPGYTPAWYNPKLEHLYIMYHIPYTVLYHTVSDIIRVILIFSSTARGRIGVWLSHNFGAHSLPVAPALNIRHSAPIARLRQWYMIYPGVTVTPHMFQAANLQI